MARLVTLGGDGRRLAEYEGFATLAAPVHELRVAASRVAPKLRDRTVWMVNSTAKGGGVAEMLPTLVNLLRDLGIRTEWVAIDSDEPEFFVLTKRIHNLIHGEGDSALDDDHRRLFERINEENAEFLLERMKPGDVLVIHDPQPMPLASILKRKVDIRALWRCHIGLDLANQATRAAWEFLRPYAGAYAHAVFSAPEYIPPFLAGQAGLIYPAIDPLSDKNRELHLHQIVGTLVNGGLAHAPGPVLTLAFSRQASWLGPDGGWNENHGLEDFGLMARPIVTQVSRWDRLKGFLQLLKAFDRLKRGLDQDDGRGGEATDLHRRRRYLVRLVLAGPDVGSVEDDPEAVEALEEVRRGYMDLDPTVRKEIAVVTLPMHSRRENGLMVNALQRASTIVVQNSLREGFGLTITEAMWKRAPILTNSMACGPRQQVRHGLDGCLARDPEDVEELSRLLDAMLADYRGRREWGRNAQRHVYEKFLVLSQLEEWMRLLHDHV